jgi:hypothetical protein
MVRLNVGLPGPFSVSTRVRGGGGLGWFFVVLIAVGATFAWPWVMIPVWVALLVWFGWKLFQRRS